MQFQLQLWQFQFHSYSNDGNIGIGNKFQFRSGIEPGFDSNSWLKYVHEYRHDLWAGRVDAASFKHFVSLTGRVYAASFNCTTISCYWSILCFYYYYSSILCLYIVATKMHITLANNNYYSTMDRCNRYIILHYLLHYFSLPLCNISNVVGYRMTATGNCSSSVNIIYFVQILLRKHVISIVYCKAFQNTGHELRTVNV